MNTNKKKSIFASSNLGGIKTKNAFTLIELLAIIVILAIIAVITVPIILNVIDESKKGAVKDSAYGYKKAIESYYATEIMNQPELKFEGEYSITTDGKITDGTNTYDINMSGQTPTGGYLTYENNILKNGCITIDEYKTIIENGEVTTVEKGECSKPKCIRAIELHTEECTETDSKYSCSGQGYTLTGTKGTTTIIYGTPENKIIEGQLQSGDAFTCDVNGDGKYNEANERFYYVSDLYNTKTKKFDDKYAVLVYYNNTIVDANGNVIPDNTKSSLVEYDKTHDRKNWYGPLTAKNNLPTINDWSNVSLSSNIRAILGKNDVTSTTGGDLPESFIYEKDVNGINIPLAARLLTSKEITVACGQEYFPSSVGNLNSCNYLMENTKYSSSQLGTYGYWIETPNDSDKVRAWAVYSTYRSLCTDYVDYKTHYAVRPAIEVLKTDIDY